MNLKYFVVDVFTDKSFGGNPADVCLLDSWLPDEMLQYIAMENNLSETAFLVRRRSRHVMDVRYTMLAGGSVYDLCE